MRNSKIRSIRPRLREEPREPQTPRKIEVEGEEEQEEKGAKEMMERDAAVVDASSQRRSLIFLLSLLFLLLSDSASGTGARREGAAAKETSPAVSQMRRPAFLYTRHRGRCTAQFWSSRREAWPKMVPHTASVSKIFGSRALERYRGDLTVLEAAERNDDSTNAFSGLLKQSTAALLNSYSREGFPYTAWQVKTLFIRSLVSVQSAAQQARLFARANEACL